ncbi:AraC family transcriptional regulator [Echinimonas agarilytica]|uniref:Substrate-binding domain-containing protein n=1 Tax=Echinimonas agarilytica TaxID=1215918 RepID=A0AA41W403_9GAMM|nr:substrate-binding domain-containing protein [Echinimonas agarilytica]MCM2678409.1 substrate-binding domain-containing protein [Echinimonas agarilytica]
MNHKKITLLFNPNQYFDRLIIEGIGQYLQAIQLDWSMHIETDVTQCVGPIDECLGDAVIADFDHPDIRERLRDYTKPMVAVGSSYENELAYPHRPFVASDNYALMNAAYQHLTDRGLHRVAFYGPTETPSTRWIGERERALIQLSNAQGQPLNIYRAPESGFNSPHEHISDIAQWLTSLDLPIGLIAANDSCARSVLLAAQQAEIAVPDQLAVIGVDDDDITRHLHRISLSSVVQSNQEMGYQAAKTLHLMLQGQTTSPNIIKFGPSNLVAKQSTEFTSLNDKLVIEAMQFIRQHATQGIKVSDITQHLGVSRSNLEARFKNERGHSIHHEIHQAKITRAQRLLSSTMLPTREIAELCGYPSLQYMYAVFSKNFGYTPKEYRNKNHKKKLSEG